jgi:hypothetical protein
VTGPPRWRAVEIKVGHGQRQGLGDPHPSADQRAAKAGRCCCRRPGTGDLVAGAGSRARRGRPGAPGRRSPVGGDEPVGDGVAEADDEGLERVVERLGRPLPDSESSTSHSRSSGAVSAVSLRWPRWGRIRNSPWRR